MDVPAIFTLSRGNTWTDAVNMPDSVLITITNVTYRDLINRIVATVGEKFFYDEWTATTVVGQTEYSFPERTASVSGLKKVESVSVKWATSDEDWVKADPTTITNFTRDKSFVAENQPKAYPIYLVYDKSVNIYPAPTEEGIIKIYGTSDPVDLQTGWAESTVKIPLDFHHLIVLGNEYRIYKYRRLTNEKNDALAEYEAECKKMIEQLSDRITQPLESEMPGLNHLE